MPADGFTYDYMVNNQTIVSHVTYVLAAGQSLQASAANKLRNYLFIYNKGTATALWRFDAPADTLTGVPILAAGQKEWDSVVPRQSLNLYSASGTTIIVVEGVRPTS